MAEAVTAGVAASEVLRARFRTQVARYRELVAHSVDTGGMLSEGEVAELVELCEALKLPPDRFEQDRGELVGLRQVEVRLAEVNAKNATRVADVPALEAEITRLSAEFGRIRSEAESRCGALEKQMAELRREIRKEERRHREPTDRWEREIMERHEANPVMFQRDVEPGEWASLLRPRKRTIRN
jgi:hypothetical protein